MAEGTRPNTSVLFVSVLAIACTALFVSAHWTIAVVGAAVVLALSVAESEGFLLFAVFLTPLGWALSWDLPVRDVPVAIRSLVIVGFFFGHLLRGRRVAADLLRPALSRASLLFLCAAAMPTILRAGEFTHDSARFLWTLSSFIGFYFVVVAWANSPQRIRRILRVLLYSTIFTAAFAILQEIVGDYTSLWYFLNPLQEFVPMDHRAPSFFGNCNSLAGYLNLVIPFSLACWVLLKGKWKLLGAWTTGLGVVALLCTQSLGGLVSLGAVVVFAILSFARSRGEKLALLGAVCALAVAFYFAKETLNPAHEGATLAYDQATRVVLWGIAWDLFVHSPILGVGWGNFAVLYGSYLGEISWIPEGQFAAHNIYLQLLSETGLVGFSAFFLLMFRALRQVSHQLRCSVNTFARALAFGILGALLSVLLHGFVDFFFDVSPQFGTLFWLLLALLAVSGKAFGETAASWQAVKQGVGPNPLPAVSGVA